MSPTIKNQLQDMNNDYVYDAAGNLTQPGPIGGPYVYDAENHLTSAAGVTYTYDGDGNRVMKSNGTIYWYGANSASLMETDLSGNVQRWYYFFDGQRVARQLSTNETGFYMTDHLGSVRYLGGSATGYKLDYYPYGGVITDSDTGDDRYQFTGKERDSESGLDNFGARYYSSNLGRFMSPDPDNTGATLQSPQSWNAYSYVLNNPLNAIDATGLDCVYTAGAVDNPDSHADGSATVIRGDCKSDQDSGVFVDNAANRPVQSSDVTLSNDGSVGIVSYTRTDGITTGYACVGNCPSDTVQVNATPTMSADPYPMSPAARSLMTVPFDFWNQTPQQHADIQACMATGGEYGGETLEPPDVGQAIAQVHEPNGKPAQYKGNNKRKIPNIKGAKKTPTVTGPLGILEFITDGMNCVQNVANQHQ
jgi:RHS repeat-associated protein